MNWNIKDKGDSVEKIAAKKFGSDKIISMYNEYWGQYIGNSGGKPLIIKGIDTDINRSRLFMGQCNYTLLQNYLFLSLIDGIPTVINKKENHKLVKSLKIFYESTHTLYNSIEIVDHYNGYPLYENKSTINLDSLYSFKKFRNAIAHSFRPDLQINQCLFVPKNFELFKDWSDGDNKIWTLDSMGKIEYWSIFEYINFLKEQNKQLLFQLLKKSLEFADNKLKQNKIDQTSLLLKLDNNIFPEISGSTSAI
jgi:hypothetical protein